MNRSDEILFGDIQFDYDAYMKHYRGSREYPSMMIDADVPWLIAKVKQLEKELADEKAMASK